MWKRRFWKWTRVHRTSILEPSDIKKLITWETMSSTEAETDLQPIVCDIFLLTTSLTLLNRRRADPTTWKAEESELRLAWSGTARLLRRYGCTELIAVRRSSDDLPFETIPAIRTADRKYCQDAIQNKYDAWNSRDTSLVFARQSTREWWPFVSHVYVRLAEKNTTKKRRKETSRHLHSSSYWTSEYWRL